MNQNVVGQPKTVQVPNYSGVNIQIFNPSVAAPGAALPTSTVNAQNYSTTTNSYPQEYYTKNLAQQPQTNPVQPVAPVNDKKTEKREVVELTDNYIKTLENYLNNENKEIRLMGAKEVLARLEEDPARKDDPALNALINKMLQDPHKPIKLIAMSALESRAITGNDKSVMILNNIQNSQTAHGLDAVTASNVLLKMAGVKGTREVAVPKDNSKNKRT